jgi:6-phosphogluconolactonase/glucosamine-6-phosphate isomerase/deaminase
MTYPLINASRFIGVLVTGESKRQMIGRVAARHDDPEELPILGIHPVGADGAGTSESGILKWYLDHEACPLG